MRSSCCCISAAAARLPVGKIGARLQVHPASVTNAVDRLEAAGFVRRSRNPSDGRGIIASLTDAGRSRALTATAELNPIFETFPLESDALEELTSALQAVRRARGDFE